MTDKPIQWEKEFSKQFTDNILFNGHGNDLIISKEDVEPLMDFISKVVMQAEVNICLQSFKILQEEKHQAILKERKRVIEFVKRKVLPAPKFGNEKEDILYQRLEKLTN